MIANEGTEKVLCGVFLCPSSRQNWLQVQVLWWGCIFTEGVHAATTESLLVYLPEGLGFLQICCKQKRHQRQKATFFLSYTVANPKSFANYNIRRLTGEESRTTLRFARIKFWTSLPCGKKCCFLIFQWCLVTKHSCRENASKYSI